MKILTKSDVKITFTKKDGTERVLNATLNVPEEQRPKGVEESSAASEVEVTKARPPLPDSHMRVFDRDAQGWRTVILENIKEVVPHEADY